MKRKIHIIGGGITGCTLAFFLKKDFSITLYEKSPHLGGLLYTHKNIENIPYQIGQQILHTDTSWVYNLINKYIPLSRVVYNVGINPLFDFRYYKYPFDLQSIANMPWHWKEAISSDLEKSNGDTAKNLKELIINFYGETIYNQFYESYIQKWFGIKAEKIDIVDWVRKIIRSASDISPYYSEPSYFPVNVGYNNVFSELTKDIEVHVNTRITYKDLPKNEIVIFTGDVDSLINSDTRLYVKGSFDIDSAIYKENSPDTMIYPNHTPFTSITQFGKFFPNYEKNIVLKEYHDDGDICLYPRPTEKNRKEYTRIVNEYNNIIFAGRFGSWKFLDIDDCMKQASQIAAQIKSRRE